MPKRVPEDRLEQLVEGALRVFVTQGYARTQMADVAAALGVAKGTLYLYVASKEALFDTVARLADAERPFATRPALPIPTPALGATLSYVQDRLAQTQVPPALAKALSRARVGNPRAEVETIIGQLYDTFASNRNGIKLLDSSARDYPELAALWFDGARGGLLVLLTKYLDDRVRSRKLRRFPDSSIVARLIVETTVYWAVHRHWETRPQPIDESAARETAVRFIVSALAKE